MLSAANTKTSVCVYFFEIPILLSCKQGNPYRETQSNIGILDSSAGLCST